MNRTGRGGRMGRRVGTVVLAALALPVVPALPALSPLHAFQDFHSLSSELAVLPLVVTDKHGGFVTDLPKDAFAVYDNGRRVPIDVFTSDDTPVTVGLVIDASGSMRSKIGEVIAAAMSFVRLSNPDDELFAIRFNDDVQPVTRDGGTVSLDDAGEIRHALLSIRPDGRTALYDGLIEALDRLDRATRPRKVLILISDGGDNVSKATRDAVLARARRSNASIYAVGLFDSADPDRNPRLLKQLAREIRAGYPRGYAPPDRDGAFYRVRVGVKPGDGRQVEVRTRAGYFAGVS